MVVSSLSICIPTYNRSKKLFRLLKQIDDQLDDGLESRALQVLVSDNASTDATQEVLGAFHPKRFKLRTFRQPRNVGPDQNCLFLTQQVDTDYSWWFGDDDILNPGAISRVWNALDLHAPDVLLFSFDQPPYTNGNRAFDFAEPVRIVESPREMCECMVRWRKMSAYVLRNPPVPFADPCFHYANAFMWFWLSYAFAVLAASRTPRLAVISEPLARCDEDVLRVEWDIALCSQELWRALDHPFPKQHAPCLWREAQREAKRELIRSWFDACVRKCCKTPPQRGYAYLPKPRFRTEFRYASATDLGRLLVLGTNNESAYALYRWLADKGRGIRRRLNLIRTRNVTAKKRA